MRLEDQPPRPPLPAQPVVKSLPALKSFQLPAAAAAAAVAAQLIILTVLVTAGCTWANRAGQTATKQQLTPNEAAEQFAPEPQPSLVAIPKQPETASGYCSMANGCPADKCRTILHCSGSGENSAGCAPGEPTCEYKDLNSRDQYRELSARQAKRRVQEFLAKNQNVYKTLRDLRIDEDEFEPESGYCADVLDDRSKLNRKDRFCWFIALRHKTDQNFPYAPQFYVGAQTGTVYWDIPKQFKVNLSSLTRVRYSPDQAIKCAEKYIAANQTEYLEYKNFVPGSLTIPDGAGGLHSAITNHSKDALSYTVIGRSSPNSIYLVVGAHSCTVYGVNEKLYTKP